MQFKAYADRIMSLNDFMNSKPKKIKQNRFQIKTPK